jgi:uncharacterized membrane protein
MPEESANSSKAGLHRLFSAAVSAALNLVLLVSVCATIYMIQVSSKSDPFTEFYLLSMNGTANDYPREFNISETQPVIVGIRNQEHRDMEYRLAVVLENGTTTYDLHEERVKLADNATWLKQIGITPPVHGAGLKLDFQLYNTENETVPYRDCYLFINVTKPWVPIRAIQ